MKAWITYDYLEVIEQDRDGEVLDKEYWDYGTEVEVIIVTPPSVTSIWGIFHNGMFLVRSGTQIQAFDGQFISFLNPLGRELN